MTLRVKKGGESVCACLPLVVKIIFETCVTRVPVLMRLADIFLPHVFLGFKMHRVKRFHHQNWNEYIIFAGVSQPEVGTRSTWKYFK